MPLAYYVYYRVGALDEATLEPCVRRVLDEVRSATGIQGRLLKQHPGGGTWMEAYEGVVDPARFDEALAVAVARAGFPAELQRKAERFAE